MAVINPKNYFGLQLTELVKNMFIDRFVKEVPEAHRTLRMTYAWAYMQETGINYLLSKQAQATIETIKLSDPKKVFGMLIEHADPQGATILLDKDRFFRYIPINDRGNEDLMGIYLERVWLPESQSVDIEGKKVRNYYLNYESFRIMKDDYSHPHALNGMPAELLTFIKTLIFIKCTNVETYLMKDQQKERVPHMKDPKWINKSGREVRLINADWNRMYVRAEGFSVSGHARLQRHGPENKQVKLIWIDSYVKSGYKRQFHH